MTETTALLPCPFCGHDAEIERFGDARRSTIYQCTYCSCSLETGEEWGHGRRWNERAALSIDVGPNVAVQDVAEQVERRINERGGEAAADEIVALTIEVLWEMLRATPPTASDTITAAEAAHAQGRDAFAAWWNAADRDQRLQVVDGARHLLAALAASPAGWRSMDSAPKDGTEIILTNGVSVSAGVWISDAEMRVIEQASCDYDLDEQRGAPGDGGMWSSSISDATAWMPLPLATGAPVSQSSPDHGNVLFTISDMVARLEVGLEADDGDAINDPAPDQEEALDEIDDAADWLVSRLDGKEASIFLRDNTWLVTVKRVGSATPAAGEALTEALESIACHADEVASKSETERRRAEDGTKTGVAHASLYLGMKVAAESIAEEVRRRAAALAAARKEG
jgi:hypothetical protein